MVQAQLERRQLGEQFRVLESAFEALEPTSPNRPMIILLGLLFGVTLGVGLAVVLVLSVEIQHLLVGLKYMNNLGRLVVRGLRLPIVDREQEVSALSSL